MATMTTVALVYGEWAEINARLQYVTGPDSAAAGELLDLVTLARDWEADEDRPETELLPVAMTVEEAALLQRLTAD